MMKILVSSSNSMTRHGMTSVILNLYRAMDRRDMQMDFVVVREPDEAYRREIEGNGCRLTVIPRSMKHPFRYIRELSRAAKGYDVLHAHGNSATLFLEMAAAKMGGIPLRVAHGHSTSCRFRAMHRMMYVPFNMLCNGRLACGTEAGKWLFGKRPFDIVQNGIDLNRYSFRIETRAHIREQYGFDTDDKVIGHIGSFIALKNHRYILDVFRELYRKDARYKLMLLGSGPLADETEKLAEQFGIASRITFIGSTDDVPAYLSAMDVFLMPSLFEGLPLTLIEAQANGLPIVASDAVTREVNATDTVTFLSLNESVETWCDVVQRASVMDRQAQSEVNRARLAAAGFSIGDTARKLREYYIAHAKG